MSYVLSKLFLLGHHCLAVKENIVRKPGLSFRYHQPALSKRGDHGITFSVWKVALARYPLQGKGPFSYREGKSIDHYACSRRIGDFRLLYIRSSGFLTMFSFTDVSDVQDKLRENLWVKNVTLVLIRCRSRNPKVSEAGALPFVALIYIKATKYNMSPVCLFSRCLSRDRLDLTILSSSIGIFRLDRYGAENTHGCRDINSSSGKLR